MTKRIIIPKAKPLPKLVPSASYDGGTHTKELPLICNVQWRDYGKRVRPTAEQLSIEHGLEEVTLTLLRDTRQVKSSFQPRAKGKFTEHWTDEDKVTCNPHSLYGPFTGTGQFFLSLLGSQYRLSGMTSPYLKFKDRARGREYSVARISQVGRDLVIEALPGSQYLSDSDYVKMFTFLCKPVSVEVGFLSDGKPICLYPDEYPDFELAQWLNIPTIDASNPVYDVPNSRFKIKGTHTKVETFIPIVQQWEEYIDGDYVLKSRKTTKVEYISTWDCSIVVETVAPKKYVLDWLTWHPIASNLTKVKAVMHGQPKPERSKDARDRKYKRTTRKQA